MHLQAIETFFIQKEAFWARAFKSWDSIRTNVRAAAIVNSTFINILKFLRCSCIMSQF